MNAGLRLALTRELNQQPNTSQLEVGRVKLGSEATPTPQNTEREHIEMMHMHMVKMALSHNDKESSIK